ncbi:hypothetical protein PBAL39_09051 [Pedobacter sp. BAL39]|nr:hypothetical protein PBAL39_09051 [Pedobacter sp. BAL39]
MYDGKNNWSIDKFQFILTSLNFKDWFSIFKKKKQHPKTH